MEIKLLKPNPADEKQLCYDLMREFELECAVLLTFFSFFSFTSDYTGRPVVVMNEAVLRRSPMVLYSLLCIVVASGQKSLIIIIIIIIIIGH